SLQLQLEQALPVIAAFNNAASLANTSGNNILPPVLDKNVGSTPSVSGQNFGANLGANTSVRSGDNFSANLSTPVGTSPTAAPSTTANPAPPVSSSQNVTAVAPESTATQTQFNPYTARSLALLQSDIERMLLTLAAINNGSISGANPIAAGAATNQAQGT